MDNIEEKGGAGSNTSSLKGPPDGINSNPFKQQSLINSANHLRCNTTHFANNKDVEDLQLQEETLPVDDTFNTSA